MKLAKGEEIIRDYNCDEMPRLLSRSYRTTLLVTNKRIIRRSASKKWGRHSIFTQDIDLDSIAGFSSVSKSTNKIMLGSLYALGASIIIVGLVFLGLLLASAQGEEPLVLIPMGTTILTFGLFIFRKGLGAGTTPTSRYGLLKISLLITGVTFIVTGAYFFVLALLDTAIFTELLRQYEFIFSVIWPPIGIIIIAFATSIKPYTSFQIHIKYTQVNFTVLRRTTMFESIRKQKIELRLCSKMLEMFDELPAIVRERKGGKHEPATN